MSRFAPFLYVAAVLHLARPLALAAQGILAGFSGPDFTYNPGSVALPHLPAWAFYAVLAVFLAAELVDYVGQQRKQWSKEW